MDLGEVLGRTPTSSVQDEIDPIISKTHSDLIARMSLRGWDFHAHLGTHFISQYSLFAKWLGKTSTPLDARRLVDELLKTQLPDGSWKQLPDRNISGGEINATIFNYWALKGLGFSPDDLVMSKARSFILSRGGLQAGSLFTQLILALFGNLSWDVVPATPYLIFEEWFPANYRRFSQWVIPHLMAIAYLRKHRVTQSLGPRYQLAELMAKGRAYKPGRRRGPEKLSTGDHQLIEKILENQQPAGSWGGYTLSTLLSMMALDHYRKHHPAADPEATRAIAKGFGFVEPLYFDAEEISYHGALMDGKNWDTLLIGGSLLESGLSREAVRPAVEYIVRTQQPNGGFPYGDDFEYAPDVDDTAMAVILLSHYPEHAESLELAAQWLCRSQNKDGGWGAFDRGNGGNPFLRTLTKSYQDSVELFDASSADITGHILEALTYAGHHVDNSPVARDAVEYLKRTQGESGHWIGRWGVNYLYGTSCALSGLLRAGVKPSEPFVQKALAWMLSRQNADGGFGETTESYLKPELAGVGYSAPSITGWVLTALCQAGFARSEAAGRAAQYLVKEFRRHGRWKDETVVGTGHPGLLYMNYPSYAYAFPLMALSQYRRCVGEQAAPSVPFDQSMVPVGRRRFARARLAVSTQVSMLVRDTFVFVVIRHLAKQFNLI